MLTAFVSICAFPGCTYFENLKRQEPLIKKKTILSVFSGIRWMPR